MNPRLFSAMQAAMLNKHNDVRDLGIGDKLPLTLLGWNGDHLIAVVNPETSIADDHQRRFEALFHAALGIHAEFGLTAISLTSEGFQSERNTGVPYVQRFASGDPAVKETLLAVHVEGDEAWLLTVPFMYVVPRAVQFGLFNLEDTTGGAYVDAFRQVLHSDRTGVPYRPIGVEVWLSPPCGGPSPQ